MQTFLTFPAQPLKRIAAGLALTVSLALPAHTQSLFSPVITVNGDPITRFELEQRQLFLEILSAPGDRNKLAREGLIDDRLKQQLFDQIDFSSSPEDVKAGIDEFASRANLSGDEMIKALEEAGVARQTMENFIDVTITWREYIGGRFSGKARPTDAEIDRAIGQGGTGGGVQVLLSEIIIPVSPQTLGQVEELADQIANLESYEEFSQAALQYSAAASRDNGGRMDWLTLSTLPPALQPVIMALNPGDVTEPVTLPNAVALFQMRGIREAATGTPKYASIEYATYYIAGGRTAETLATAASIADRIDTCDDLYGVAKDQPPEVLEIHSKAPGSIPNDIAIELAKLDSGETSTALTTSGGQNLILLMLCGRTTELAEDASREQISSALANQRLASFADSLLSQLRADAVIVEK
ncbi:peptidylprolyl isomerase [Phaeobacter marinintestinus]|uniref:peptidylprolyl isomerase n=1 Tax=Falsiphaeobacter marinintestinus TaxID=1492905 RepID=UPI0011B6E02D|nr:peptidylprolyl isomerase [Phaeobacter marinintestinus]